MSQFDQQDYDTFGRDVYPEKFQDNGIVLACLLIISFIVFFHF